MPIKHLNKFNKFNLITEGDETWSPSKENITNDLTLALESLESFFDSDVKIKNFEYKIDKMNTMTGCEFQLTAENKTQFFYIKHRYMQMEVNISLPNEIDKDFRDIKYVKIRRYPENWGQGDHEPGYDILFELSKDIINNLKFI